MVSDLENQIRSIQRQLKCKANCGDTGTPSLPLNSVQYNNNGEFFGDELFTRDPVTGAMVIASTTGDINIGTTSGGSIIANSNGGTVELIAEDGGEPVQIILDPTLQSIILQTVGTIVIGDGQGVTNGTRIQVDDVNETIMMTNIPAFANNAAAFAAIGAGKIYYTDVAGEYLLKWSHA